MIQINLVKTQLPSEIDIPKKNLKIFRYGILPIVFVSAFLVILIIVAVYYIFSSKLKPENKDNLSKRAIVSADNRTVKHKTIIETGKKIKNTNPSKSQIKQNNENKKFLEALKNKKEVAFSIDIQLATIPNKVTDNNNTSGNGLDNQTALYQSIISQDNNTAKKKKLPEKKIDTLHYVTVSTSNVKKLKTFLNGHKIKYRLIKYKKSSVAYYDIFAGGFNSYSALMKFYRALEKRGYKIYDIQNISLLYYVCIDKGVTKSKKNLYLKIWKKTPFKIITKAHFKNIYGYKVTFKADSKTINRLKKLKFSPIIVSIQNGA